MWEWGGLENIHLRQQTHTWVHVPGPHHTRVHVYVKWDHFPPSESAREHLQVDVGIFGIELELGGEAAKRAISILRVRDRLLSAPTKFFSLTQVRLSLYISISCSIAGYLSLCGGRTAGLTAGHPIHPGWNQVKWSEVNRSVKQKLKKTESRKNPDPRRSRTRKKQAEKEKEKERTQFSKWNRTLNSE